MHTTDLRSDTITKPTAEMLKYMMAAHVGDDVFKEDPSVNTLEAKLAELFGMEAALFCASGTMSNQIGIKLHVQPGNEVICEAEAHVYYYEAGGIAMNSYAQVKTIKGVQGKITAQQIEEAINPNDIHKSDTTLVCLENTCNRGGGSYYTVNDIKAIQEVCLKHNLALHLDGARLWNAAIATNTPLVEYGNLFNTISVCFNKGMGCPVGSALLGTRANIERARKIRKAWGGGWRQAGYLAAAVLYALDNNYKRLQTDHEHATAIAKALQQCAWVKHVEPVYTNIILFDIAEVMGNAQDAVTVLAQHGILCFATGINRVRLVTHLHITAQDVDYIINMLTHSIKV
jgi:threonine aldolase